MMMYALVGFNAFIITYDLLLFAAITGAI